MPVRRPMDGATLPRTDAHLQPLLGVSPLGPVMLSKENIAQAHMLETVYRHLPQPADSEKVRYVIVRLLAVHTIYSCLCNLCLF